MSVLPVSIWTSFLHPRLFDAIGDVVGVEDVVEVEVHVDRNWWLFLKFRIAILLKINDRALLIFIKKVFKTRKIRVPLLALEDQIRS